VKINITNWVRLIQLKKHKTTSTPPKRPKRSRKTVLTIRAENKSEIAIVTTKGYIFIFSNTNYTRKKNNACISPILS
jgi:hypothetical protein